MISSKRIPISSLILLTVVMCGCVRSPFPPTGQEMRISYDDLSNDQIDRESFSVAIGRQISNFEGQSGTLKFGPVVVPVADYLAALKKLDKDIVSDANSPLSELVGRYFSSMEIYGDREWGGAFITGYFEPRIKGSLRKTDKFSQPLYRKPADLKAVFIREFSQRFKDESALRGRVDGDRVIPYYSRKEIDSVGVLRGQNLEICWVDPIDSFFLHIQGSGVVELADGREINLTFADKNGLKYEPIGKFIKDQIAPAKVTMQSIISYLRGLDGSKRQEIFNLNPSYVFFNTSKARAITASGVPATAGRTIAFDAKFYPRGALAFLKLKDPDTGESLDRFVFSQDAGGAITGPGRVDLFIGSGDNAGYFAGRLQQRGKLYFLVPRAG